MRRIKLNKHDIEYFKFMTKALVLISVLAFSLVLLTGCSSKQSISVNTNSTDISANVGFGNFINIGDSDFVYDSATRIIYIDQYTYNAHYVKVPYYAPNGLPYRYNPATNTFEEIIRQGE